MNGPRIRWQASDHTFLLFYSWRNWFFRLWNYGLSTQPLAGHWQTFSERRGRIPVWHGLGQCWRVLRP